MKKTVKYVAIALLLFVPICYFLPKLALFYAICGIYDVARNRAIDGFVIRQYFLGNGVLTWLLSPFNILMDILALPYINKGVYRLEDLPRGYQAEVQRLIDAAYEVNLVGQIEERAKEQQRTMVFFKWYGSNVDTFLDVPAFHEKFKYIQTIGVSVFNKKVSTSKHYGPLRATLRVLYNINTMEDKSAYLVVGNVTHYWCENKLFIFDDTLMHQSFNETDKPRYCLFVDIVRPGLLPAFFVFIVRLLRFFLQGVNSIFYKNWKVIRK